MPILLCMACVAAGAYGVLHDQLTYWLSPDYYHAFKFLQFRVPPDQRNWLGAAIVGWKATWWMGALVGGPVVLAAFAFRDPAEYRRRCVRGFIVVALVAAAFGVLAGLYGLATIGPDALPAFAYPEGVVDRAAFARVGVIHNASYAGGAAGLLAALIDMAIARVRAARRGR